MGITYLPGPEALLAPAAREISQAVVKYLRPHKEFQEQMQRAIGQNPALAQQLADMEAGAPGTLQRLGFGGLGGTIAQLPPSPARQFELQNREKITRGMGARLEAETATAEATPGALGRKETLEKQAIGRGERREIVEELELSDEQRRRDLVKTLPELGEIDFYEEARRFSRGELSGERIAGYFADPLTRDPFIMALREHQRMQEIAARKVAEKSAKSDVMADRLEARRMQNAFLAWQSSGDAGTVDAWQEFMYNPQAQERGRALAEGREKPKDFAEEMLAEVGVAASRMTGTRFDASKNRLTTQITSGLRTVEDGSVSPELRMEAARRVNTAFDELGKLGGRNVRLVFEERKFRRDVGPYFEDDKGNRLSTSQVEEYISNPREDATSTLPPPLLSVLDKISRAPDVSAALNQYRLQDRSPNKQNTTALEAELRRQGLL